MRGPNLIDFSFCFVIAFSITSFFQTFHKVLDASAPQGGFGAKELGGGFRCVSFVVLFCSICYFRNAS